MMRGAQEPNRQPSTLRLWKKACIAFTPGILINNLLLAFIVGLLLTLVNQYDAFPFKHVSPGFAIKLLFNFLVPFVVSSVSAAMNHQIE